MKYVTLATIAFFGNAKAFSPNPIHASRSSTQLNFVIPTFGAGKDKEDKPETGKNQEDKPEMKIGLSGIMQLITAGVGSPFLGDFEGIEEETGKMMFSLEANNLVDEVSC